MTIDGGLLLEAVRDNARMLRDAAAKAGLEARVATCPDWSVNDLLIHVGTVHRWVHSLVESRSQEFMRYPKEAQEAPDRLAWFDEGAERLLATFEGLEEGATVWNWIQNGPGPGQWWVRRMAHEMVIHRVDAESALGAISGVDPPELAADGLDELFGLLPVRHARNEAMQALGTDFHFHCTDVPGEWVVDLSAGKIEVRREHAKCTVAVRGPASALELFTYNRIAAGDEIQVFGDPALMEAWTSAVRF